MEYKMYLSKEKNIPQRSRVGEFVKIKDESFKCFIVLDDYSILESKMREIFSTKQEENGELVYYIVLTEALLNKIQSGKKYQQFALYHELGHIHFRHLFQYTSQEEISLNRQHAINNGTVTIDEQEADAFAVRYLGKSAAICFLDNAIRERRIVNAVQKNPTSPKNLAAIKELECRKKIIQRF